MGLLLPGPGKFGGSLVTQLSSDLFYFLTVLTSFSKRFISANQAESTDLYVEFANKHLQVDSHVWIKY